MDKHKHKHVNTWGDGIGHIISSKFTRMICIPEKNNARHAALYVFTRLPGVIKCIIEYQIKYNI